MGQRVVLDVACGVAQRVEFGQLVRHLAPPRDEIHLDEFERVLQLGIGERRLGVLLEAWRGRGVGHGRGPGSRLGGAPIAFAFDSDHKNGYTVGAGVEYMFAQNWSAKVEYQYYNFGKSRFIAPAALAPFGSFTTDDHVVKAGLNYRFNWGGPVVAKY